MQKQVALAEALPIVQATELPSGNEFTVCYQTLTLRSCSLSRRNVRLEFFPALIVEQRAARFSGRRKRLISWRRTGH